MQKRDIWLWSSYDLANSLASVIVAFYFGLWIVEEKGAGDIWISLPMAIATLVLLVCLPKLGAWSDRIRRRMPFVIALTFGSVASLGALGFYAVGIDTLTTGALAICVALFTLYQFFFQAALAFYMALLQELSAVKSKEKVAGLGIAAGQFGNIVGIIIALPLAEGAFSLFGYDGRAATLILGAAAFFVGVLPMFLLFRESHGGPRVSMATQTSTNTLATLRETPGLLRYLCVFYLFADAILTLQTFITLYLAQVGGISDKEKTIVMAAGLLCAVISAALAGAFARRIGSNKKASVRSFSCGLCSSWRLHLQHQSPHS